MTERRRHPDDIGVLPNPDRLLRGWWFEPLDRRPLRRARFIATFAWCLWLVVGMTVGVGLVYEAHARDWPTANALVAVSASVTVFAIGAIGAWIALRRTAWIATYVWACAWAVCGFAPAAVRAALPWEEPETGMGSPLATLISVVLLAAVFGATSLVAGFTVVGLLERDGLLVEREMNERAFAITH